MIVDLMETTNKSKLTRDCVCCLKSIVPGPHPPLIGRCCTQSLSFRPFGIREKCAPNAIDLGNKRVKIQWPTL